MAYEKQTRAIAGSQADKLNELKCAAVEASANAIIITDRSGIIVWVNAAFERLTGYLLHELEGQSTRLLKSGAHVPSFYKELWDTILDGRQWHGELRNRRKDGALYWEEMTVTPIRDHTGEIAHFVAIKKDISDRRKSEERLSMLAQAVENSSELIAMTDAELRISFANRALLAALRYSEENEILGQNILTIISPNNPPDLAAEIATRTMEDGAWRGECLHLRADGTDYPVLLSTTNATDQAGRFVGTLGIAQDITERKRAEREILFKNALLEAQTEASIDAILAVDEANNVILSNQQFAAMWGVPLEIVRRRDDDQLLRNVMSQVENSEEFYDKVKHLYAHREEKSRDELRLKDGRILDRYSAPLIDSTGRYCGRIWFFRDITESKRAAEKLRASEEQFRQIAENIREVFFVMTPDPPKMEFLSSAYSDIWGTSPDEVYERPDAWMEAVHPDDRQKVGALFEQSRLGIQTDSAYRIRRPDGSIRWIESRAFPVRDAEGKFVRVVGIAEDTTTRREKENVLRETHEKLNVALRDLQEQTEGAARLAELVDILQSCQNAEEAYKITGNVLGSMWPGTAGALYITSPSRDIVEMAAHWGNVKGTEKVFRPDDCWALRRGKVHRVSDSESPLRCAHSNVSATGDCICVPLVAQGETLGVLYVESATPPSNSAAESPRHSARFPEGQSTAVAERISLALANLRLREVLRGQSIRDPLTGLFNRRFMEESLGRELRRAMRGKQQVALLMLDIDHFKRFNDTFGHQAGDALLRALGNLLKESTRGQDVVCRYGGEEFAFVLAGASLDAAHRRAELLREDIKHLNARHGGQLLGAVTLSVGIAVFPENGDTAEILLKAADDALYRAKETGRDKIVCAPGPQIPNR